MAKQLEKERAAIAAEEAKLEERRRRLAEREREEALAVIEKSGLLKLDSRQLESLLGRIKALGFEEATRRLAA